MVMVRSSRGLEPCCGHLLRTHAARVEECGERLERLLRLGRQLEGSSVGFGRVDVQHAHDSNAALVEQLNGQVDFLSEQLAKGEAELELAEAKLRHGTVSGMVTETELRVYKALVIVKDAEIARLRLHAAG